MELHGLQQSLIQGNKDLQKTTVKAKVVASGDNNRFTVQVADKQIEVIVDNLDKPLSIGDSVEIPINTIVESLNTQSSTSDIISLQNNQLDQLFHFLLESPSNELATRSENGKEVQFSQVDFFIAVLRELPEEVQKEIASIIFEKLSDYIENSVSGIDEIIDNKSSIAINDLVSHVLDDLFSELPKLYETMSQTEKSSLLDVFSKVIPLLFPRTDSKIEGVYSLNRSLATFNDSSTEDEQRFPIVSPKDIPVTDMVRTESQNISDNDGFMKIREKILSFFKSIPGNETLSVISYKPEHHTIDSNVATNTNRPEISLAKQSVSMSSIDNRVNEISFVKVVLPENLPSEIKKMMAIKFPLLASTVSTETIAVAAKLGVQIPYKAFEELEENLRTFNLNPTEERFVKQAVNEILRDTIISGESSQVKALKTIVEPVTSQVSLLNSIVTRLEKIDSEEIPKSLLGATEQLKQSISTVLEQFSSLSSSESNSNTPFLKRFADAWGLLFERTLFQASEGEGKPSKPGVKQNLSLLNKHITDFLVSKALVINSDNEDLQKLKSELKQVSQDISESIRKLEGTQLLAKSQETSKERGQIVWMPVHVNGEWTRLGIEFKRERKKKGRGGSLGNRVAIHMDLNKMGTFSADLDLDINKQLRVNLGASKTKAALWFKEHETEIYESLQHSGIRSVILKISALNSESGTDQKRDSFQVSA